MGRQKAYCECFDNYDFLMLEKSVINNVYRNVAQFGDEPALLTKYCKDCIYEFNNKNIEYFLSHDFCFPKIDIYLCNQSF